LNNTENNINADGSEAVYGTEQKLELIQSVFDYLNQIERNRFMLEKLYLENKTDEFMDHWASLMNGVAWLEYTVMLLEIQMDIDKKNRLFEGVSEAVNDVDMITIVDFIAYPLVEYIHMTREAFEFESVNMIGGEL
jgi:hypothetical protein